MAKTSMKIKQQMAPKFSTRAYNRCKICGRPHAYLRKYGVSLAVLSQFMPIQYTKVREGVLENDPEVLIKDRIKNTIDEYLFASHQEKLF